MMDWTPQPQDIEFAKRITSMIRDGGSWGVPETGQIYQFDSEHKIMKLINPETLIGGDNLKLHERIQCVFGKIGWKVEAVGNA